MKVVLTPAEMAEADQHAIASGTPEAVLVERAGSAVARHALRMLGGAYGRRVTVIAGKGNNGADGRVAARRLRAQGVGVDELSLEAGFEPDDLRRVIDRADLVIDAMYGTGFRGELEGAAAEVAAYTSSARVPVLAVDIPSGVNGATGATSGPAVRASETICFAAYKPGLLFEPGRSLAGRVTIADIGIAGEVGGRLMVFDVTDLALPAPGADSHKWSSGCLVVGGSSGMVGAPLLAGRAALRCGAGMVVCAVPGKHAAAQVSGRELVARALPATANGALDADAASAVLKDVPRYRALAIGPGLGRESGTQSTARRIVAEADVAIVIDADALNAIAVDPSVLRVRHGAGFPLAVLTPHGGEYERLAGKPVGEDRVAAARDLAEQLQAIVLLKGPGTVIAAPDGRTVVNRTGGPALATAGTGDVLTGIIGGLLAQGVDPFEAAATGAYVHGRAADAAPASPDIVASDLVRALPRTLHALRTGRDPWET
jgi:ADP-dependent NAD(P)H-hydrate dehydratase / NAD(P)H-hydrate epimerase